MLRWYEHATGYNRINGDFARRRGAVRVAVNKEYADPRRRYVAMVAETGTHLSFFHHERYLQLCSGSGVLDQQCPLQICSRVVTTANAVGVISSADPFRRKRFVRIAKELAGLLLCF